MSTVVYNLGDIPTWVNAFASISSLFVALAAVFVGGIAAKAAADMTKLELTREAKRLEEDEEHQAKAVSAWCQYVDDSSNTTEPLVGAMVWNGSTLPIYEIVISVFSGDDFLQTDYLEMVAPGRSRKRILISDTVNAVKAKVKGLDSQNITNRQFGESVSDNLRLEISFKDAFNKFWFKDRNGVLSKQETTR